MSAIWSGHVAVRLAMDGGVALVIAASLGCARTEQRPLFDLSSPQEPDGGGGTTASIDPDGSVILPEADVLQSPVVIESPQQRQKVPVRLATTSVGNITIVPPSPIATITTTTPTASQCSGPLTPEPESFCRSSPGEVLPFVNAASASDVHALGSGLFVSRAEQHIAALNYLSSASDPAAGYIGWKCFDYVPNIRRIAAHSHADGTEVLAVTALGEVYSRFNVDGLWREWRRLDVLESGSCVQDVAATGSGSGTNYRFLYVEGVVYESHVDGAFPMFTSWARIADVGGSRLAALSVEGGEWVFALDSAGAPLVARQVRAEPGANFGAFAPVGIGAPALTAIDATASQDGEVEALGLDSAGAVWVLGPALDLDAVAWARADADDATPALVEISAGALTNAGGVWFGVTKDGTVVHYDDSSDAQWRSLSPQ